jgi:uncharacterized protein (UPF0332 family)
VSLPADLLEQAHHLARREPKRPKMASLRRAISTAYYALFHLLTEEASSFLISGSRPDREALRLTARRALAHSDMKAVSNGVRDPQSKVSRVWLSGLAVMPDLRDVAQAFVELQEARHQADYDLGKSFTRQEAADLVDRCTEAFASWERCRKSPAAEAYLVAIALNSRLRA